MEALSTLRRAVLDFSKAVFSRMLRMSREKYSKFIPVKFEGTLTPPRQFSSAVLS